MSAAKTAAPMPNAGSLASSRPADPNTSQPPPPTSTASALPAATTPASNGAPNGAPVPESIPRSKFAPSHPHVERLTAVDPLSTASHGRSLLCVSPDWQVQDVHPKQRRVRGGAALRDPGDHRAGRVRRGVQRAGHEDQHARGHQEDRERIRPPLAGQEDAARAQAVQVLPARERQHSAPHHSASHCRRSRACAASPLSPAASLGRCCADAQILSLERVMRPHSPNFNNMSVGDTASQCAVVPSPVFPDADSARPVLPPSCVPATS